jgi:hypothetical protein
MPVEATSHLPHIETQTMAAMHGHRAVGMYLSAIFDHFWSFLALFGNWVHFQPEGFLSMPRPKLVSLAELPEAYLGM